MKIKIDIDQDKNSMSATVELNERVFHIVKLGEDLKLQIFNREDEKAKIS